MKELLRYSVLAALAITTAASCKKKDDSPTCRIITATDVYTNSGTTTTSTLNYTYNNDGQISTLTLSDGTTTTQKIYNYNGNTIIVNSTQGGSFSGRDSVTLNSNGRVTNFRHFSNSSGTNWYNFSYEFDGNGALLKSIYTLSSGGSPSTTTFTSSNGDLATGSDGSVYGYYTDKPYQQGDYFYFIFLINYGAEIVKNAHLLKSITTSGSIRNCTYDFTDGRISKMTVTGTSSIDVVTYQYQCN